MATTDDELFGAEHVRVYRETDGERGYHWRGTTILLLTTVGAHIGRAADDPADPPHRRRALGRRRVKGRHAGEPGVVREPPGKPEATIEVKGDRIEVRASTAEGEERARLWSLMTEVWPAYDEYQARTEREIPIVVLSRR